MKKAKILASVVAVISVIMGLDYIFRASMMQIRLGGVLVILGGVCAAIAVRVMGSSKSWERRSIFGFFFLAGGQVVAILAGVELLLSPRVSYCSVTALDSLCLRLNEVFLGLGMHFSLFVLCALVVYEILAPKKMRQFKSEM